MENLSVTNKNIAQSRLSFLTEDLIFRILVQIDQLCMSFRFLQNCSRITSICLIPSITRNQAVRSFILLSYKDLHHIRTMLKN